MCPTQTNNKVILQDITSSNWSSFQTNINYLGPEDDVVGGAVGKDVGLTGACVVTGVTDDDDDG